MKKLLLITILCIIVAIASSCSSKESSSPANGIPEWAGALMRTVPDNTRFVAFLDIETLRTDPDLRPYYTDRQNWFYNSSSFYDFSENMFDFDQMEYWISGTYGDLITGSFNIEAVKDTLTNNSWLQSTYDNFSVFEKENCWGQKENIAFVEEFIIGGLNSLGNSIIDTIKGKQPSIYENGDFQDLMTQLPANGFEISYGNNEFTTSDGASINLQAGNSISKIDDASIRYTYIVTAQNNPLSDKTIEELVAGIRNYSDAFSQTDVEVTRHESYVKITADIPISSFSVNISTP